MSIAVSRNHCEMYIDSSKALFIKDLSSKFRTFVNGKEIASNERVAVRSGDVVRFGSSASHVRFILKSLVFTGTLIHYKHYASAFC